MATNEYPIDDEFWKWWNEFWARQDSTNKKVDISLDFCYNNYIKETEEKNPELLRRKHGTFELH